MGTMTGVNMLIKDAETLAYQCLSEINNYKVTALNKLILREEAFKQEVAEMNGFQRWWNAELIRWKTAEFRVQKSLVKLKYEESEKLAESIIESVALSGTPWIFMAASDIGLLTKEFK